MTMRHPSQLSEEIQEANFSEILNFVLCMQEIYDYRSESTFFFLIIFFFVITFFTDAKTYIFLKLRSENATSNRS